MRRIWILVILGITPLMALPQTHKSVKSHIRFFSSAPMEDIEAVNTRGTSLFDAETGEIAFSIPIQGFQFEKSLMQEHFNENYLESDKYPTATFKGKIIGFDKSAPGKQKAKAEGVMTIHGVSRKVTIDGDLTLAEKSMKVHAVFPVKVADYKIKIPTIVFYNIAEVVEVTVTFDYEKI